MKLNPANRSLDKLRAGLLYVGVVTVITVVIWVSVSIYASYSKPSIDPDIQAIIKPINPSLDNQVLINYSSSRVRPPEQFQIISMIKEGNQITQTLIDPYGIGIPPSKIAQNSNTSETDTPEEELDLSETDTPEEEIDVPEADSSESEIAP